MFINSFISRALLVIFILPILCVISNATVTLTLGTDSGDPGDTVGVAIAMTNTTEQVSGIALRIVYDEDVLEPFDIQTTSRTEFFDTSDGNYWNYNLGDGVVRLVAYSMVQAYVEPGNGDIAIIKFEILENASGGTSPVEFESEEDSDNRLSDPNGTLITPASLSDGYVTVSGAYNNAPYFSPSLVTPRTVEAGSSLQFTVTALDDDGDALTLSASSVPTNASFSEAEGNGEVSSTFSFSPSSSQEGESYSVIFSVTDDIATTDGTVVINVGSSNESPVISTSSSTQVSEGEHLELIVSATDPQSEYVTLSASNLPENSSFDGVSGYGTVVDTFFFDPDYSQAGLYSITFIATDASGNSSQSPVTVTVIDAVNDVISVASGQGALPGSLDRSLIINMQNASPIYALQFDLIYDPLVIEITDAVADSARAYDFTMFQNSIEDGRYRIGILPMDLDTIPSGSGSIVEFTIDVDGDALAGTSVVTFDSAYTVQDSAGSTVEMLFDDGTFTIDILGDANLDGVLSIGDCVAVLAYVIGRLDMNVRTADAADYNRDGDVRIADLQGIIFEIFDMVSLSPPLSTDGGSIELIRDNIYSGYYGDIPLWLDLNTEAAAVQFTIEYDPSQVVVSSVTPGDMVSSLNLEYNDMEGEIRGAIYTFNFTEFGPAMGELVNIGIDAIGDNVDPTTSIKLTDFEIVAVDASKLNVDIIGELPVAYELHQNYPNPFNAKTTISFDLPFNSDVQVAVYNVLGQEIKEIYSSYTEAGSHQVIWDGTSTDGDEVASGIYFYRIIAEDFNETKKMLLVK